MPQIVRTGGCLPLFGAEIPAAQEESNGMQFHYIGAKVLKGIYSGFPSPLFLMSLPDCMPETWEGEAEQDPGLPEIKKGSRSCLFR